ncbi:putative late blight resistance protein homolog R1B-11 [Solanum dulcamara]|uniref:putative late blight resistance protein homolog R1B-11 n=1 Tax=Solanum dulcamara TaxID=45834 RepID=UPI0024854BCB|nr:putative late blight resistance protein homolog R1B-11 [Solanum dulcamara]
MDIIEVSYKELPNNLKPCFLYFGAFLEDKEISVSKLIWLWIAEVFVLETKHKMLKDIAEFYMDDLSGRNLVFATKRRSTGGVKSCRIHDLLHAFCLEKAKECNYLLWIYGDHDPDSLHSFCEKPYYRRLSIYSTREAID